MKLKGILSAFVFFASVLPALSQETDLTDSSEQTPLTPLEQALSQVPDLAASSEPVPFTTIEQGQVSRFSTDNPDVQPVFSDPESWKSLWTSKRCMESNPYGKDLRRLRHTRPRSFTSHTTDSR